MAGNNGHKQTKKNNHFLWSLIDLTLSGNFGTYQATKQLTKKILTYYCLKMQKSKRGIMKCQRENDWIGITERDTAFKYTWRIPVFQICPYLYASLLLSRIISCYAMWRWQFCQPKTFLSPIWSLKAQREQRKISSLSKWKAKKENQAGFFYVCGSLQVW